MLVPHPRELFTCIRVHICSTFMAEAAATPQYYDVTLRTTTIIHIIHRSMYIELKAEKKKKAYFLAPSALQLQALLELLALVFVLLHLLLRLAHLLLQAIEQGAALDSSRHFAM